MNSSHLKHFPLLRSGNCLKSFAQPIAPLTPEQQARQQIDAMLVASGWIIQDYKALNLGAGLGIAVREVPLKTGPCDYLLLVNRKPVGVIEAKKKGTTLSAIADQSARYAS